MADEFVWMRHSDHGGYWQCPTPAIAYWTPRGWVPSDPPPEIDPTRAHVVDAFAAEPSRETPDPTPAQATAPESKPTKSGKAGSTEGAE